MNTETIVDNPMMLIHLHWESDDPDDERTRIIAVGLHPNDEIGSVDYATIEKAFTLTILYLLSKPSGRASRNAWANSSTPCVRIIRYKK